MNHEELKRKGRLYLLWHCYGGFQTVKKSTPFWLSVLVSLFLLSKPFITKENYLDYLFALAKLITEVFPNLVGFTLGGYAMLIGFGSYSFLKILAKDKSEDKISTYQNLSAMFGWAVFMQACCLIVGVSLYYYLQNTTGIFNAIINSNVILLLALLSFSLSTLLTLLMSYSLILTANTVLNVFRFSYTHQVYLEHDGDQE